MRTGKVHFCVRRKVIVMRAVDEIDFLPDFAGEKRALSAARTAAASRSANPLDETTLTEDTVPCSVIESSSTTSPSSLRCRAPFG